MHPPIHNESTLHSQEKLQVFWYPRWQNGNLFVSSDGKMASVWSLRWKFVAQIRRAGGASWSSSAWLLHICNLYPSVPLLVIIIIILPIVVFVVLIINHTFIPSYLYLIIFIILWLLTFHICNLYPSLPDLIIIIIMYSPSPSSSLSFSSWTASLQFWLSYSSVSSWLFRPYS